MELEGRAPVVILNAPVVILNAVKNLGLTASDSSQAQNDADDAC